MTLKRLYSLQYVILVIALLKKPETMDLSTLFNSQMRTALWHNSWSGDIRIGNLTCKDAYLLFHLTITFSCIILERITLGKDIVTNYGIVVGGTSHAPLHVCPVAVVCYMTDLYIPFDELVDRNIHLELQESRNIHVTL